MTDFIIVRFLSIEEYKIKSMGIHFRVRVRLSIWCNVCLHYRQTLGLYAISCIYPSSVCQYLHQNTRSNCSVGKLEMKQHLISSCRKLIKVAKRKAGLAAKKWNFSFSATFSHDFLKEIYGNPRSRKPKLHFPRDQLFAARI